MARTVAIVGVPSSAGAFAPGGERAPLLNPAQVVLFGWDPEQATELDDTPISENTGRNEGLAFETALRTLRSLPASPLLAGRATT